MIDLLINLLTPLFVSIGASAADVANYINIVSGYIYAAVAVLAVVIVVMIAAHFIAKKGTRHVIRWSAVGAFILAVVLIVNLVCYGPLYSTVSGVLNASKAEISDDVVGNSVATISETGDEGMVLVKNNGILPLKAEGTKLNVFGWTSINPVYSGSGSANSGDAGPAVSILKSLADAGFSMNNDLVQMYLQYESTRPTITMQNQDWTLPEPTKAAYTANVMSTATSFSDTAVIVIGRSGGENADLPADMNAVINGTYNLANTDIIPDNYKNNYGYTGGVYRNNGDYDDFEPGEHYLELSRTEEDLVELVCSTFENVIVVINANNAMELDWVDKYDSIGAVMLVPGTGNSAMTALGRIFNGTVNPSGKTVDTYVKDLTNTVTWNHYGNSGNHIYNDIGSEQKQIGRNDSTFQGVISFTDYTEGIYTGYRFYETAADVGAIQYEDHVQYPFGYGLSYTTFSQEMTGFKQDDKNITVEVTVKNTGTVAGKDVVELYFTPPYTEGGIEKASVNLLDFGKTAILEAGASEKINFTIPLEELSSYDSSCIKTANGGYILEAGDYNVSIRSDSHTVLDSRAFTLASDIDYSTDGRESDGTTAVNRFAYAESDHAVLSRKGNFANYAEAAAAPSEAEMELSKAEKKIVKNWSVYGYDPEDYDNAEDIMPTLGAKNGLVLADLTGKSYDDPQWEQLLDQMSLEDMITLINTGGWKTAPIESVGKVATSDCDGPAGLSNYVTRTMGTQFCTEVMLAQTWNKEIAAKYGSAVAQEFANANNFGWYGPGMNMHRSAFGGRNFEYFSEDPVLSGKMASAEINAAAQFGVYAFMKHFAVNDQETNRCAFLLTYLSEQSLRENVLKPFEIAVKNFNYDTGVLGAMTSYNWLGTVPVISNYDLLTDVLRNEWGFVGTVISDYNGSYGYQISDAAIRAGNDLMLGYGMAESNQFTDTAAATCVLAMRQACKNILYTVGNSGYYSDGAVIQDEGMTNMDRLFVMVDAISVVLVLVVLAFVIIRWRIKKKKNAVVA